MAIAQAASVTCLAVFAFLFLFVPLLSRFAIVLGIAFPIALLIFARWNRPRATAAPIVA